MTTIKRVDGAGKKQLQNLLKNLDRNQVAKVGWFEKNKYPDGTPVAYVASIHEFGSPKGNIPKRSFMRVAVSNHLKEWKELSVKGAKAVLKGISTFHDVLDGIGGRAAGDVRKIISLIKAPPLSLVTLLLRKRKKDGKEVKTKDIWNAFSEVAKDAKIKNKYKKQIDVNGVSTKPLVDTRILITTLTHSVEEE